jgi:decaprenylphospho-beta-D-ribofuranose 2-oxidase
MVMEGPAGFEVVSGASGSHHGYCAVLPAGGEAECRSALEKCRRNGWTIGPRGHACSYADSPVNSDNAVLDCRGMSAIESWDPGSGVMQVQAGASIADVLRLSLKHGWVLRSVPGGISVTVGGAIAHNVHGKDAARQGNFGRHLLWADLMLAGGEIRRFSRESDPEAFSAIAGGMGLFGVILRCALRLERPPSSCLDVETVVTRDIEQTLGAMERARGMDYGQGWVDALARGRRLGRGFVKLARFVESPRRIDDAEIDRSLAENTRVFGLFPAPIFWRLARPALLPPWMAAVNAGFYYAHLLGRSFRPQSREEMLSQFYFFHNNIPDFYAAYKPPGLVCVQALVPKRAGPEAFVRLIEMAQNCAVPAVLSGMKRHRPDDFLVSFEGEGTSVSFDFPLQGADASALKRDVIKILEYLAGIGARQNLSKDQWLPRAVFREMYPRWKKFSEIRDRLDPGGAFGNDMSRRLLGR